MTYTCRKCGGTQFRANIYQHVDVDLDDTGEIVKVGINFSDPEIEKDKVWCNSCGEFLK